MGFRGACIRLDWGLYRALWGVLEGFRSHSPASLQIRASGLVASLVPFPLSSFPCCVPSSLVGFRSLLAGCIGAAGPVVFLVLLGGARLPFLGLGFSREHQDHRQRGQRGCRSFLPLGPDRLTAPAQLRQDLSTEIAPNEGKIG